MPRDESKRSGAPGGEFGSRIEIGTEISSSACRLNGAKKADPSHGIENAGLDKIHVVAGDRSRGAGFAAKTIFQETTMFLVKSRNGRRRHQNSSSHSSCGRGKSVSNISQQNPDTGACGRGG